MEKAKYRLMVVTASKIISILVLFEDLGRTNLKTSLLCWTTGAMNIAVNLTYHERTKYVKIDRHLI